ncbi:hypothetical protein F5Y07DRAFT_394213 [Xylaria sp. FL0933]|nr:hypothetical protein F5Y07DRAFT_394213 [Xylaria sp. FL0933]
MLTINQTPSITEDPFVAHSISVEQHEDQDSAGVQRKEKGKAIAQDNDEIISPAETSTDALTVDWTKYEPPEGLKHLGDIEGIDSEIFTQIIQQSIDRVKARIFEEEEEKRKIEAETERGSEEERADEENEAATTSRPEDIEGQPDEDATQINGPDWPLSSNQDIPKPDEAPRSFPTESPKRPPRRPLLNFFRKRNGAPEHGESSAAGAARSRFPLASSSSSHGELKSHLVRKRFVSDLIKRATGEDSSAIEPEGPDVECVSCLDEFPSRATVRVPCHSYCTPCFQRLISTACQNEQHWPPKCCLNPIPAHLIHSSVNSTQWTEYRARALEWNQPASDRIYCFHPECALFIRPEHVIPVRGVARCADGHYTCALCRNAAHEGDACPQDADVARTNELAEEAGWKRCPRCAAFVEHADGCQHMTCRCGAEFCYVCGASWHTCACTMAHLATYLEEAEARRLERADREAREEGELAEALRLVAEFERQEEENAAAQRERERRLAEERWRRRYKELEASRREAAARFEELREVVAEVHENQRVVVQEHQDRRERQLRIKGDAVKRRMLDLHELERETQKVKVEERIARRREKFQAEYRARAVEEMEIKEQYAAKLRAFWEGKEDGEKEIEAALKDLRRQMDEYFQEWKKWWDNDLATYRHSLREEQAIHEELMEEKERRLESRRREVMLDVAKRKTAELRWVREVFEERGRLLDELEASEIEKLGDVSDEFPGDVVEAEGWLEHLRDE